MRAQTKKAGRLRRVDPLWVSVDQPGFPTREVGLANYFPQPQPEVLPSPPQPPLQPQSQGQQGVQTVTVTGTCLQTQCGTQRVTV